MRALPIASLALATLLAPAPAGAADGPFADLPPRTVDCARAAGNVGVPSPGSLEVGPVHMPGRDEIGSHWSPRAGRFSSKVPLVLFGSRPVTLSVPPRLLGRVALVYGRVGFASEIEFQPCPGRRATFFPGGLLFQRREPIALLVQVRGWPRPRPLRFGVFPPY